MKRKIFTLIVGLMLTMTALAQKTVAVYVTSSESVKQETKKILGSELVAAITKTADYVAVERTADFMAQVAKEQSNYDIDDAALYNLGRKFGASNVCVADVAKYGDDYYIVARLLDIKTSKVWKTAKKYSSLSSLRELVETSEALANDLFGTKKEFSTYAYGDNRNNHSFITKIENRETFTKVTMKYVATSYAEQIGVLRTTYIEDLISGEKYYLTNTSNINIIDDINKKYKTINPGIVEYALFFERLSDDATNITVIEPGGMEYKDIVLKPYGEKNLYVFEDNAERVYEEWRQQKKEKFQDKKYSTYAYGDIKQDQGYITRIENIDTNTKVTIKFFSTKRQKLGIDRGTYIENLATHEKYYLQDVYNINITDKKRGMGKINEGIVEYSLFFSKISDNVKKIEIIEPGGKQFKNIVLNPYIEDNVFVFEDFAQQLYDKQKAFEEAYMRLIVSYDRNASKGYEYVSTIQKTSMQYGKGFDDIAIDDCLVELKMEAVKLGCLLMVVTNQEVKKGKAIITAELYKFNSESH